MPCLHVVKLLIVALIIMPTWTTVAQTTPTIVTVEAFRASNVRSGPGVNFDVIDIIERGEVVTATGRSDRFSNWLQVDLGTRRGWVAYFTVAVEGDVERLPILSTVASPPTPTPSGTVANLPQATSDLFVTAFRRVNVRTGPGTDFSVLGVLAPGQTADIIGTSDATNEWLQIDFGGTPGWVAYFVVTISGDVSQLQGPMEPDAVNVVEDSDDTELVLNQVVIVTRFNTNLRERPVLGADIITVIPYETTVQALARTEDNRWLQVRHGDDVGWLISSLTNTQTANLDALPVLGDDIAQPTE